MYQRLKTLEVTQVECEMSYFLLCVCGADVCSVKFAVCSSGCSANFNAITDYSSYSGAIF